MRKFRTSDQDRRSGARAQPTRKASRDASRRSAGARTAEDAHAAELVEPKQSDIEHVLPDADRLVHKIMERDEIAPGYALAVALGIAAHLGDGYPDMPDFLKRTPSRPRPTRAADRYRAGRMPAPTMLRSD